MASVSWNKCKGGRDAKAKFWHCDTQKRLDHEHANKQIDKSRTRMNLAFGWFVGGYKKVCEQYDVWMNYLDKKPNANKRKDRVTCVGWSLPVPEGMNDVQAQDWFTKAYTLIAGRYGGCVLGGTAHFDEVHEYADAKTGKKKMSRPHLHVYAVPVVGDKLNAKQFMSRKNMVAMNSMIEEMTQEYFPDFKFQDGSKRKSKATVEELKNQSALKEAEAKAKQIIKEAEAKAKVNLDTASEKRLKAHNMLAEAKGILLEVNSLKKAYEASEGYYKSALDWMKGMKFKNGLTLFDKFEEERRRQSKQEVKTRRLSECKSSEDIQERIKRMQDGIFGIAEYVTDKANREKYDKENIF